MTSYTKWVLAAAVAVVSLSGLAPASPAGTTNDTAEVRMSDYQGTKYLCQKCYNGCWQTVYTCYSYQEAMNWYNRQRSNARVIAQK
jgi:hypothetical protein